MFRPIVFPALLLLAAPAAATTLSWKAATSGLASTASNWNPAQAPTSADDAVFSVAGSYTVTWNGVAATHSQTYRQGTVTSTSNGAHTIGTTLKIAELAGENATLSVAVGAITATSAFTVAGAAGSTGVLNVSGPSASITTANTSDIIVGALGTGSVNVTNGGSVSVANFSQFGSGASGTGNLLVSGVTASLVRSHFSSGATAAGTLSFGGTGHGTANIDAGARLDATNKVVIASQPGSVGSVIVQNSGGGFSSSFNVNGTLDVAVGGGTAAGGTGTFELFNGGTADIGGLTTVGDADGGTGTLRVQNKCRLTTGGLVVNDAHGVLDFTGGTIEVDGGVFDPPGTTLDLAGNSRTVRLLSGASASFSNSPFNAYCLIVGETGTATFDVLGGSTLLTNATTAVGLIAAANGTLRVENPNSTWGSSGISQLVLGVTGTGNLSVAGGGHLTSNILTAGFATGSHAFIDVAGANSRIDGTSITFGGTGTTPGGSTFVTVTSGGTIRSDGDAFAIRILPPATVNVDPGSRLETPFGELDNRGTLNLNGGTIDAAGFDLGATGFLSGHGTVHGVFSAPDTTAYLTANGGILELGDSTVNDAFRMAGLFKVNAEDVRVRSRNQTALERCTMTGGTLTVRPGGANVPAQRSLQGSGTLDTRLVNFGSILASSVAGFTFRDTLVCTTGVLSGTKFTFAPGSTYLGNVTLNSDAVVAQAGSRIQTTGGLSIGKNAATTSVTLAGELIVSQNAIVHVNHLVSTAPCELGTRTRLASGSNLLRSNGFSLASGDTLEGLGTIQGPLVNTGVVTPGVEGVAGTPNLATLSVTGAYTQNSGGRLVVQIGDAPTGQFDRLLVSGVATLTGTLDVRLPPGFSPSPGEQFMVMTCGSRSGIFSAVTFQGQLPGSALSVSYTPTAVIVTAGTIPVGVPDPPLPAVLAFGGTSGMSAAFTLALPDKSHVRVAVYGPTGRRVAVLCDGDLPAGTTRFPLEASGLHSGVWFARAEIATPRGRETRTARATLLR